MYVSGIRYIVTEIWHFQDARTSSSPQPSAWTGKVCIYYTETSFLYLCMHGLAVEEKRERRRGMGIKKHLLGKPYTTESLQKFCPPTAVTSLQHFLDYLVNEVPSPGTLIVD